MLTKELFFENLKELRSLRDESVPVCTDFALLFLSKQSDFSVKTYRLQLVDTTDPMRVIAAYYKDLVDPDFYKNLDKKDPNKENCKPITHCKRCPFGNRWVSGNCCCMRGGAQQNLGGALQLVFTSMKQKDVLVDMAERTARDKKYEFTNYVFTVLDRVEQNYVNTYKKAFHIKNFFDYERGGIRYATVHDWMGSETLKAWQESHKAKGRKKKKPDGFKYGPSVRPEFIAIVGFMVATEALLDKDAKTVLYRAGYNISHQFDLDLVVEYFMNVMGSDRNLQKDLPLTVQLFNDALEYLNINTKKNCLTLPKAPPSSKVKNA